MRNVGRMKQPLFWMILLTILTPLALSAQDKVRIYVTDSDSWSTSGGFVSGDDLGLGGSSGGARPQTVEIVKTFNQRCPRLTVTIKKENADYIVMLDHEGGKQIFRVNNKIAVFNGEGDAIYSGSTRSLGNAVKDVCQAIYKDQGWNRP